jgi:hypothetical protein
MHASPVVPLLRRWLRRACPPVYAARATAVVTVVEALVLGAKLALTHLGRNLRGAAFAKYRKYRIKRVDRVLRNAHVHHERALVYRAIARWLLAATPRPILPESTSKTLRRTPALSATTTGGAMPFRHHSRTAMPKRSANQPRRANRLRSDGCLAAPRRRTASFSRRPPSGSATASTSSDAAPTGGDPPRCAARAAPRGDVALVTPAAQLRRPLLASVVARAVGGACQRAVEEVPREFVVRPLLRVAHIRRPLPPPCRPFVQWRRHRQSRVARGPQWERGHEAL